MISGSRAVRPETRDERLERGVSCLASRVSRLAPPTVALSREGSAGFGIDPYALGALCLVVPLQPAGEEYHYTLLLIVLLTLLSQTGLALLRSRAAAVGAALACLLFALPSYFLQTAEWQGWPIALLAYPRMYGALVLWGIFVIRSDSSLVQPSIS